MIFGVRKYRKYSDEELVLTFAQKPSRDILQVIFERYGHLVLGLCLKYLKQMENAEDMCAAIFEKLPELLMKHDVKYFKSWLYQVARNECLMILRKKKQHLIPIEEVQVGYDEINESGTRENEIQSLEKALLELKKEQRECLALFYLEDLSYQEISEQKSININKVKSHIQNGKRNLKMKLEGRNHE